MLVEMERKLGSVQTRNWGTLGGNLCHSDPAGDPAPLLIAMNGKLKTASRRGERTITVEDFSTGYLETVLKDDEILTEVQVPNPPPHTGTAFTKFSLMEGDMAIVGTAVSITLSSRNGICRDARIALSAVASVPIRAKKAERVLEGREIRDNLLKEVAEVASEESSPVSDIHASEKYRKELVRVLVMRVAEDALGRARRN